MATTTAATTTTTPTEQKPAVLPPTAPVPSTPAPAVTTLPPATEIDPQLAKLVRETGMDMKQFRLLLEHSKEMSAQLAEKEALVKQLSEEKKQKVREALTPRLEKMKMKFEDKDWMDIDELATSQKPGHQKLVKFMTQLPADAEQPKTPSTPSTAPSTAMEEASAAATKQLAAVDSKRKGKRDVPNADEDDESPDPGLLKKQHTIAMEASESEVDKECIKTTLEQIRAAQDRSAHSGKSAQDLFGDCMVFVGKRQ